jgi:hypothetical protein
VLDCWAVSALEPHETSVEVSDSVRRHRRPRKSSKSEREARGMDGSESTNRRLSVYEHCTTVLCAFDAIVFCTAQTFPSVSGCECLYLA